MSFLSMPFSPYTDPDSTPGQKHRMGFQSLRGPNFMALLIGANFRGKAEPCNLDPYCMVMGVPPLVGVFLPHLKFNITSRFLHPVIVALALLDV